MQAFTLAAMMGAEKTNFHMKIKSQWTMKYRSRSLVQGVCLKGMSRTITIKDLRLAAITDVEKTKIR